MRLYTDLPSTTAFGTQTLLVEPLYAQFSVDLVAWDQDSFFLEFSPANVHIPDFVSRNRDVQWALNLLDLSLQNGTRLLPNGPVGPRIRRTGRRPERRQNRSGQEIDGERAPLNEVSLIAYARGGTLPSNIVMYQSGALSGDGSIFSTHLDELHALGYAGDSNSWEAINSAIATLNVNASNENRAILLLATSDEISASTSEGFGDLFGELGLPTVAFLNEAGISAHVVSMGPMSIDAFSTTEGTVTWLREPGKNLTLS